MPRYTINKEERLKSRKIINQLFKEGISIMNIPLRVLYIPKSTGKYPAAAAFVVPKRFIKKAVVRNLIKRRIKEAYRLFKPEFYQLLADTGKQYHIIIIYQSEKISGFKIIEKQLTKSLRSLAAKQT